MYVCIQYNGRHNVRDLDITGWAHLSESWGSGYKPHERQGNVAAVANEPRETTSLALFER